MICPAAALASRLHPLAFGRDQRGPSEVCFSPCPMEHRLHTESQSVLSATQNSGRRERPFPTTCDLCSYHFPCTCRDHSWSVGHFVCPAENPDMLGDNSSLSAVSRRQRRARVRRMSRRKLACLPTLTVVDGPTIWLRGHKRRKS